MKLHHYINGKKVSTNSVDIIGYKKNSNNYEFYLDNIHNYIYITDRLVFKRTSNDYEFCIEIGKVNNCYINMINEKQIVYVNVLEASYKVNEKYVDIEYKIETDEDKHHIILEIE